MVGGEAHAQQILLPTSPAEVPGPAPGTAMTRAYVQALARTAYVFLRSFYQDPKNLARAV